MNAVAQSGLRQAWCGAKASVFARQTQASVNFDGDAIVLIALQIMGLLTFTAACLVGWAFGVNMMADLVIAALNVALLTRKPKSVIHHSDQSSQYTSVAFGKRCNESGVRPSMGTVGDAYDDAMTESFFGMLECELIDPRI